MIKITLIRHGKTKGNINKAYIGITDEELYNRELIEIPENKYPWAEIVFSSPLKRCVQSAKLIYPNKFPIIIEGLKECDFGDFEGKNYNELKDNAAYQLWIDSSGTSAFPNGEDGVDFRKRCIEAFGNIIQNSIADKAKSIAIICHGGTIMAILEKFSYPNKGFYNWQVENLSGFTFNYDEKLKFASNIERFV